MDRIQVRPLRPWEGRRRHRLKRLLRNQANRRPARIVLLLRGGVRNREIARLVWHAAPEASRTFKLGGVLPDARYEVESYGGSKKNVKGSALETWTVQLKPRSFQLLFDQNLNR